MGRVAAVALVVVMLTCASKKAEAAITFEEIAATGDAIPDGGGATYTRMTGATIADGTVVFSGFEAGGIRGIYASSGGTLSTVVDTNTAIPSGTGNFAFFQGHSVSNGTVYFTGDDGIIDGQSGAYSVPVAGGTPTLIANRSTPVPDGGAFDDFDVFISTGSNSGTVAIEASLGPSDDAIYTHDGSSFTTIVNSNTQIPGTTNDFRLVSSPDVSADGTVAFQGSGLPSNPFEGIYTGAGGSLTTIVDSTTAMPNSTGTFQDLSAPSISNGGTVAFSAIGTEVIAATGANFSGIYTSTGGVLSVIADATMLTPDGNPFVSFAPPTTVPIWDNSVAFIGVDVNDLTSPEMLRESLYLSRDGTLHELLTIRTFDLVNGTDWVGSMFFGRELEAIFLSQDALEGDTLAFNALFTDGTWGVYTSAFAPEAIPEPSSLALLGIIGFGFAGNCWRRRRMAGGDRPESAS